MDSSSCPQHDNLRAGTVLRADQRADGASVGRCLACGSSLLNVAGPGTRLSSVCPTAYPCEWCEKRCRGYYGRPGHPCHTCSKKYPWLLD